MSGGVAAYMLWLNRPFYGFLTFDMDKLGIIRRHQWKERLKISKAAKFESDLLKLNENIALQSREILQTFVWLGSQIWSFFNSEIEKKIILYFLRRKNLAFLTDYFSYLSKGHHRSSSCNWKVL